jgi:hypothetical protein
VSGLTLVMLLVLCTSSVVTITVFGGTSPSAQQTRRCKPLLLLGPVPLRSTMQPDTSGNFYHVKSLLTLEGYRA